MMNEPRNKSRVSWDYMTNQKARHAGKEIRPVRRVLITGADKSNSIGAAIEKKLQACVYETARLEVDVRDNAMQIRAAILKSFEGQLPDALVMSHGVTHLDWFEDCPEEKIRDIIDVNLIGSAIVAQEFVKLTIEEPCAKSIVSIGSMAYRAVLNGSAAYCASKAGLAHLMKCLAWELAPKGYSVFSVHPSNTEGAPMSEDTIQGLMRYRGLNRQEAEAYWGASLPKARWLQPQDIADEVEILLSGRVEYLSGGNIEMAGGQR